MFRLRLQMLGLLGVVSLFMAGSASAQGSSPAGVALSDPAVDAFVTFVAPKHSGPLSRPFVVAALDRFVSAIEAVALAHDVADAALFTTAHDIRRDVRRLYSRRSTAEAQIKKRRELFVAAAGLMTAIHAQLPAEYRVPAPRLEALERAADSLDVEDPLLKQPDSVERFFRHAAETLKAARYP